MRLPPDKPLKAGETCVSVQDFLTKVRAKYATGDATEYSYRSALEVLFESSAPELAGLNEPKRVACGALTCVTQVSHICHQTVIQNF